MVNNIIGFEDYLESLCTEHVDVQHNVSGNKSFARFLSSEEMMELTNHAGKNIVVTGAFNGKAVGDPDEQRMRQFVVLRFASYSETVTTDDIKIAVAKAFQIMMDFVARFRNDIRTIDCNELSGMRLQDFSWDEIPDQPILDNHYGWDLTIPFDVIQPGYDAGKWMVSMQTEDGSTLVTEQFEPLIQD